MITKEPQYQKQVELRNTKGLTPLGLTTSAIWHEDPRRLLFLLSRYKFVAKMLSGKEKVLEVGCGDAFAARLLLQEVHSLSTIDFDPIFVQDAQQRMEGQWGFECREHDIITGPLLEKFDAAYSLDVIEHIFPADEHRFLSNIVHSLRPNGVLIIGTPSLQSQPYASLTSKAGHVNCKDYQQLKALLTPYFGNVFIFSMNDEVLHTGFYPMAHYLLALCTDIKLEIDKNIEPSSHECKHSDDNQ